MKDFNSALFSERLKKARADKNMKQSELAQAIGVSAATISSYERSEGTKIPSLDKALVLSDVLGVSLDWLCGKDSKEVDYTDFDVKMYMTALVIVLSEMSSKVTAKGNEFTITIDNDALGGFPQRIENLLKVYHDSTLDTENFKACVDNTIERHAKNADMIGNKLLTRHNAEEVYQSVLSFIYNYGDGENEYDRSNPLSLREEITDWTGRGKYVDLFFSEKELKKY